jgi:two-component system nitrogen regulation response regulator NtrX
MEQANGGTLFLDELGDMEADIQAWLLAVLESRSFLRINGSAPVQFDARIIGATHRNLEQEVRAGRFREDLYYHLNVVPVHVPPLREHYEDIPELVNHYINVFVNQDNLPYRTFTVAALNKLRNYAWPGNVRELKNLVQRMLILGSGDEISLDEVEIALGKPTAPVETGAPHEFNLPLREAREQFERAYLEHQLRETGGSVGRVAKAAGMERTHLYRKLRALGINPKED